MVDKTNQKTLDLVICYAELSQSILDKLTGKDKNIQRDILMSMPQQYLWMFGSNFTYVSSYNNRHFYHYDMHPLAEKRGVRGDFVSAMLVNHTEGERDIAKKLREVIINSKRLALLHQLEKLDKRINNCNNDNLALWMAQRDVLKKQYKNVAARVNRVI